MTTDQKANLNVSRQVILIDKRLNFTRCHDLEDYADCCIWIERRLKGQKPLLFQGGYKQWQLLKDIDPNGVSKTIPNQYKRYKSIINNCDTALKEGKDTIICMDDNLDDTIDKKV